MSVVEWLTELGGVARRGALLRLVNRPHLEAAVASGDVVRDSRGLYCLPGADSDPLVAARLGGASSLTSAALHQGWAVKTVPDKPHVTVSRGRRINAGRSDAHLHFAEPEPAQIDGPATSVETTLEQCLRRLPCDEALSVADSARREGVGANVFETIADAARGPGGPQVRRVCREASPQPANPFESLLRAIALDVGGLNVRPQVTILVRDFTVRPDLVDERLRIVLEADSSEWHGRRSALASDTRRYNMLVVNGWIVLRFCYEDVMSHPEEVRRVLVAVVALAALLNKVRTCRWSAA